ncbi:Type III restriction enzyme, res subunit [Sphingobium yanoikuyae]|uniref:Type III restriction enzyme, res subunit n=1 Tax=Sphingobium yanoikuyae TaxID=13690 RepID=A0A084E1Y8_SPHYA|nr:DEAD/DEAH box helicase family protein [Sphingobium yanoikuyae]KEZ11980.1 Type III restriction enzyme, res subunit [Sphingobium yanoikuyae]RSU70692.1 restriction endonuclease subunit R [Sphingomonas sp. S-NIH.Pt3_0716]
MKFVFEAELPHQVAAIDAVVDLFAGQEERQSLFTIAPRQIAGELEYNEKLLGYANRSDLLEEVVLENLHIVQNRHALPASPDLNVAAKGKKDAGGDYGMDFTVEMETGTGKTYVYLRTIFELNRRYGFTKFVIVVPSVAIREGVKKTIEQTRDHFRQIYDGVPFESFVYDSGDLSRIIDFASSSSIRVMIATVQSLGSKAAVFQQAREQTRDIPGVEWVRSTRPIIIVDEPQSVDANPNGAGRQIMRAMQPLATIRYSATHVAKFHPVYRLDAFDAHDRGLVKSIEVDGAQIQDADNSPYVKLLEVEAKKGELPRARVEIAKQMKAGVSRQSVWVYDGTELTEDQASGGRTIYAGYRIGIIEKMRGGGSMQLIVPGDGVKLLEVNDTWGDVDAASLTRAMVRQTIEHHFRKEQRNRPLGIKTLSLFFIDKVADYRLYDQGGVAQPGPLATMFEEEYAKLSAQPRFQSLFADVPADAASAHDGYFSQDKKGRYTEPTLNAAGEFSNQKSRDEAERTFDLIMKDKERLLDEAEPLRFLFSHSALREGWDNPNVFQICSLREMASETRRRQSIGRGLRLCVDQTGQRRRDEGVNVLTVIAQEGYKQFAEGLQTEMEQALDIKLGIVTADLFAGLTYALPNGETAIVSVKESRAVFDGLVLAGLVDDKGNAKPELRSALAQNAVPLPTELPEQAAKLIRDMLHRLARKVQVSDAREKRQVRLNLKVLEGHDFQQLWNRISQKTTYRLDFDDAALVARCAQALRDMPRPGEARVTFELAEMLIGREGVTPEKRSTSQPQRLATTSLEVPDLLGELQNRTELPRKVLADILVQSGRLSDAAVNPSAFVDAVTAIIQAGKRLMMTRGIVYKPLDEWWAQDLFVAEDDVPVDRLVAVEHAPLDHIVTDSNIEAELAKALDISGSIKVFAKLPAAFKVMTPLGTYNPDWAIVRQHDGREDVYLVSESKGDLNTLREAEKAQISCGKAHFAALNVPFVTTSNIDGILNQV